MTQAIARVLIVDDDDAVRALAAGFLREEGFAITEARTGDEALNLVADAGSFDMVLTDLRMPGAADGIQLAEQARRINPDIPVLVTTGYPAHVEEHLSALGPPAASLEKPYSLREMSELVHSLTGL